MNYELRIKNGFTFIDVLVGTALMLIVFLGIFGAYRLGLKVISISKDRIVALSLANECIEIIRNLPYYQIESYTCQSEDPRYTINTYISNIDDSYDQLHPADEENKDYKRVRVEVTWDSQSVALISYVAPKGLETETLGPGEGSILIRVFKENLEPLSGATVKIIKLTDPPQTLYEGTTNTAGIYSVVGIAEGDELYKVVVEKSGYNTVRTYGKDEIVNGVRVVSPDKLHLTVNEGGLTEEIFYIDLLSTKTIYTEDTSTPPERIANVTFHIQGAKIIGDDKDGDPIYKYFKDLTTGADGSLTISGLEWDTYTISNTYDTTSGYTFSSNPAQPVNISPATNVSTTLTLTSTAKTFAVTIKDESNNLLEDALVKLSNSTLGYSETLLTDIDGECFFVPGQSAADYFLKVKKDGYQDYSATNISVPGAIQITLSSSS
jgi:hypothetical protein